MHVQAGSLSFISQKIVMVICGTKLYKIIIIIENIFRTESTVILSEYCPLNFFSFSFHFYFLSTYFFLTSTSYFLYYVLVIGY